MRIYFLLLFFAGSVIRNPAYTQSTDQIHYENRELIAGFLESEDMNADDYESVIESIEYLYQYPLNLNSASEQELLMIPFLNPFQINSLIEYRDTEGDFLSIYELGLVYGFTEELIMRILPYLKLDELKPAYYPELKNMFLYGHHQATLSLRRVIEKQAGFEKFDSVNNDYVYPGNPWRYYMKYSYTSSGLLDAGITMEKDPGEDFFKGSNKKGFDYYSAHMAVNNAGPIKKLIIGDYRLQCGQGLTLWSGMAPGKSSLPLNVIKRGDPLKKYSSTDENNFFRGLAGVVDIGNFSITTFLSVKNIDVNITDTLENGDIMFSSFQTGGYHRTSAEIYDENSLNEKSWGSYITYRKGRLKVGLSLINYTFNKYRQESDQLYRAHDFTGNHLLNSGTDYTFTLGRIQFAGEFSYGNEKLAAINSAVLQVNKFASFAFMYRFYPPGYFALRSSAISEGSYNSNESGLYTGTVIKPVAGLTISAYTDLFRFPWATFRADASSSGYDILIESDYSVSKVIKMSMRLKHEGYEKAGRVEIERNSLLAWVKYTGLRYNFSYEMNGNLTLKTRMDYVKVKEEDIEPDEGFMIYQDIICHMEKIPLSLYFRYAYFHTDSYISRIYAYEQEPTASFSSTALYDKGNRSYLMIRYNYKSKISLWLRFAATNYRNKEIIGSGNDLISSNSRHELKFQLTAKF